MRKPENKNQCRNNDKKQTNIPSQEQQASQGHAKTFSCRKIDLF